MSWLLLVFALQLPADSSAGNFIYESENSEKHLRIAFNGKFSFDGTQFVFYDNNAKISIRHETASFAHHLIISKTSTQYWRNDKKLTFDTEARDWLINEFPRFDALSGLGAYDNVHSWFALADNTELTSQIVDNLDQLNNDFSQPYANKTSHSPAAVHLYWVTEQDQQFYDLATLTSLMPRWLNSTNLQKQLLLIGNNSIENLELTHQLYLTSMRILPEESSIETLRELYNTRNKTGSLYIFESLQNLTLARLQSVTLVDFADSCIKSEAHLNACFELADLIYPPELKLQSLAALSNLDIPQSQATTLLTLGRKFKDDLARLQWLTMAVDRLTFDSHSVKEFIFLSEQFKRNEYASDALLHLVNNQNFSNRDWHAVLLGTKILDVKHERQRIFEQALDFIVINDESLAMFCETSKQLNQPIEHSHILYAVLQKDLTRFQKNWLIKHINTTIEDEATRENLIFVITKE